MPLLLTAVFVLLYIERDLIYLGLGGLRLNRCIYIVCVVSGYKWRERTQVLRFCKNRCEEEGNNAQQHWNYRQS